jgi:hypothetical protein
VVVIVTGTEKLAPPSVDLATNKLLLPVSGHKAKTPPKLFVLMSPPIPVPVVSAPLTWIMSQQIVNAAVIVMAAMQQRVVAKRYMTSKQELRDKHFLDN